MQQGGMMQGMHGMAHYWLDHAYGALLHRLKLAPPFFANGWGGETLAMLEKLISSAHLEQQQQQQQDPQQQHQQQHCIGAQLTWSTVWQSRSAVLQEASFPSPFTACSLPPESTIARVRLLKPRATAAPCEAPPSCVLHLAGTGDHGFRRRLRLGAPLLKDNIATLVLESPFYGNRRPILQSGAKLLCVSDLLLLGKATIEEARALLYWLQHEAGFSKLGVCGLSMGGVHAAMVGSLHPEPLAVLPLLAPCSAAVAFCEGILKHGTAWDALMRDCGSADVASASVPASPSASAQPQQQQQKLMTMEQVRERMRSVLSLTDVTKFPAPKKPDATIFVAATHDGYVPSSSVLELQRAWPGSEIRWVTGGHVSSFLLHGKVFQQAIRDALARL